MIDRTRPHPRSTPAILEEDRSAWSRHQAQLLRQRRFDAIDLTDLVREIEQVGRSNQKEIVSRLVVLTAHLLKWKYQPGGRTPSGRFTIDEQRRSIELVFEDSPSLRTHAARRFTAAYRKGRALAVRKTGLRADVFPQVAPFSLAQVLDHDVLPKEPDLYDQS